MASLSLAEGQNKAGVDWAQKAIALAPSDALYQMLLGVAYGQYVHDVSIFSQLGIAYKVRDAFQQAVQLDPNNAQARAGLAKYYILAPGIAGGSLKRPMNSWPHSTSWIPCRRPQCAPLGRNTTTTRSRRRVI